MGIFNFGNLKLNLVIVCLSLVGVQALDREISVSGKRSGQNILRAINNEDEIVSSAEQVLVTADNLPLETPSINDPEQIEIWTQVVQDLFIRWGYRIEEIPIPFGTLGSSEKFRIKYGALRGILEKLTGLPKEVKAAVNRIIRNQDEPLLSIKETSSSETISPKSCRDKILDERIIPKLNSISDLMELLVYKSKFKNKQNVENGYENEKTQLKLEILKKVQEMQNELVIAKNVDPDLKSSLKRLDDGLEGLVKLLTKNHGISKSSDPNKSTEYPDVNNEAKYVTDDLVDDISASTDKIDFDSTKDEADSEINVSEGITSTTSENTDVVENDTTEKVVNNKNEEEIENTETGDGLVKGNVETLE